MAGHQFSRFDEEKINPDPVTRMECPVRKIEPDLLLGLPYGPLAPETPHSLDTIVTRCNEMVSIHGLDDSRDSRVIPVEFSPQKVIFRGLCPIVDQDYPGIIVQKTILTGMQHLQDLEK